MTAAAALLAIAAAALGAVAGWYVRGNHPAAPDSSPTSPGDEPTPFMVEIIARFPSLMIQGPIVGWGLEVQGLLASDYAVPPGDGADPEAGLPGLDPKIWGGDS